MTEYPPSMNWNTPTTHLDSLNESDNNDKRPIMTWNLSVRPFDSMRKSNNKETNSGLVTKRTQLLSPYDSVSENNSSTSCGSVTSQDMNELFASSFDDIFNGDSHEYVDHAGEELSISTTDAASRRPALGLPFPARLHAMLEELEKKGLANIVSWQPHGRCFVVHKPKAFVDDIMPIYFKMSKFASFLRQLNLYGFQRLTGKGDDQGGYYNELFLRGKVALAYRIPRLRIKGNRVRARGNPEREPNFYTMPPIVLETLRMVPEASLVISPAPTEIPKSRVPSDHPCPLYVDFADRPCSHILPTHLMDVPSLSRERLSDDEMDTFMTILKIVPSILDDINRSVENDSDFAYLLTRLCDI